MKRRIMATMLLMVFITGQSLASSLLYASATEIPTEESLKVTETSFEVNEAQLDALFAEAEDISENLDLSVIANLNAPQEVKADKSPAVAFVLAWFIGFLGIHRAYMGTSTGTIIAYILTCGGFGIVAFVDWIVLLIGVINDDISKYVDNPKFFMW